ncbi:Ger(x)C family spore germination protein [Paenibacillus lemnae]|uniref:Ger(X)C family spore germination protein n=1 Tax=Paenibacillus lemnae TaxID=1330551 RepID=A0A848M0Q1_PAELE|nr:Ger(x)C family spore germination protein [Paenibacillus lemnae]NMO94498.1 Ger(x)C family spore germination protein [Paenibacillus lemnae]
MNRIKQGILLLCFLTQMLLVSGCEFRDIDLRLFIVAMGVDTVEDNPDVLKYTFKVAVPMGDPKSGEIKSLILTQVSSSIAKAAREIKSKVDKELDFGHCKTVLFGESYARRSIREMQEWTVRRRDTQLIMYPAVAVPDAETVLNISPATERIAGNAKALALSEEGTESPYIVKTYMFDVDRRIRDEGIDPFLPVIGIVEGGSPMLNINKVALLDKEKVRDILAPEDTKIFNLLHVRNLRTDLETMMHGNHYNLNVDRSRAVYQIITTEPGKGEIHYKITIGGNLEEKDDYNKLSHGELIELEKSFNESVAKDVETLLLKIRDTGTDPTGFGLRYFGTHWNNATEKQQWKDMYPGITFKVDVQVDIKGTGYSR